MSIFTRQFASHFNSVFAYVTLILLFAGIALVAFTQTASAGTSHNVSGFAWSENIGWISMNSNNDGGSDYGVAVAYDGAMSGYAWSENIGWITFNSADLSGCPSGTCSAQLDRPTGQVSGWARALSAVAAGVNSGGWDGWISLSGLDTGGMPYGVTVNGACSWTGWAWGSDVVGWINFNGGDGGTVSGVGYACTGAVPALTADQLPTVDIKADGFDGPITIGSAADYDISWSTTNVVPVQVGGAVVREEASAIAVSGNYAYITVDSTAAGDNFEVYDISNPVIPVKVGGIDFLNPAFGAAGRGSVAIYGNYAYVISDNANAGNIRIIDISSPASPSLVGTLNNSTNYGLNGIVRDVTVSGSYLYVASQGFTSADADLIILNLSNPTNPTLESSRSAAGHAGYVTIDGNYAYLGLDPVDASTPTFEIWDISSKANPVRLSGINVGGSMNRVTDIEVRGNYAYLGRTFSGSGDTFTIVDISNRAAPSRVSGLSFGVNVFAVELSSDGRYAFVSRHGGGTGGVNTVDVSNPLVPVNLGVSNGTYNSVDMKISGSYAFSATRGTGDLSLEVFDLSFGCVASNGTAGWPGSKDALGGTETYNEVMINTYSYLLTCTNGDGEASDTVDVTIDPVPNLTADIGALAVSSTFDITTGYYDYLTINYNVRNTGSGEANNSVLRFNIDYDNDGTVDDVHDESISMLLPTSQTGSRSINFGSNVPPGNHSVEILVDADDNVAESNEDDNLFTRQLAIGYPDPGISLNTNPDRLVRAGSTIGLTWDLNGAGYIGSCNIEGPTLGGPQAVYSGGVPTSGTLGSVGPITSKSEFLLTCVAIDGISVFTDNAIIETTGIIEEL